MIDYTYNFSDPASNWTTNLNTNRNVLLEDYTGHYCTGCPDAAAEATELPSEVSAWSKPIG